MVCLSSEQWQKLVKMGTKRTEARQVLPLRHRRVSFLINLGFDRAKSLRDCKACGPRGPYGCCPGHRVVPREAWNLQELGAAKAEVLELKASTFQTQCLVMVPFDMNQDLDLVAQKNCSTISFLL